MAKGIRVTQKEFEEIKQLLNAGVPRKMICQLKNRDDGTIAMMIKAETFDDYKVARDEITQRKRNARKTVSMDGQMKQELVKMMFFSVDPKNCPFCGSNRVAPAGARTEDGIFTYTVLCSNCGIGIFRARTEESEWNAYSSAEEAVIDWNRRSYCV